MGQFSPHSEISAVDIVDSFRVIVVRNSVVPQEDRVVSKVMTDWVPAFSESAGSDTPLSFQQGNTIRI
jgi:hypothetical protein